MGFARRPIVWWERVILFVAALALVLPGLATDGAGLVGVVVVFSRAE